MGQIIGRLEEIKLLDRLYNSGRAEFLAVYGRRRIGKTFLINQFFKDKGIFFEITGASDASVKQQLSNFHSELVALFKAEAAFKPPKNWPEAFRQLLGVLSTIDPSQKIVIFFDELPWLCSPKSGFLRALDYFWNRHASRMANLFLIVSGSAAAWMIKKVINDKGGLYGRLSAQICLKAFSLSEVEAYFQAHQIELTRKQVVEIYMATGGVPKYLTFVERGKSSTQIINSLCFKPQGVLLAEFHRLYESLFKDPYRYIKVIQLLAYKRAGLTQQEIFKALKIKASGRAQELLEELEASGFIMSLSAFGKNVKKRKFRLIDEYSLFYLSWIDELKQSILQGSDPDYWGKIQFTAAWHTWAGYVFENICLKHVAKIKKALEIFGVLTQESYWQYIPAKGEKERGAEIDLVIDRADACINLCEIKFCSSPYVMTLADAHDLARKKAIFQQKTQTRKTIFITLITPYGAVENKHYLSCVDNQIELDAFF